MRYGAVTISARDGGESSGKWVGVAYPFVRPLDGISPGRGSRSDAHLLGLRAGHAAGVEITATCGGRGRCTSCRVKFVSGTIPPPTIMDELQLGDGLVREGYRLSCQCHVTDSIS